MVQKQVVQIKESGSLNQNYDKGIKIFLVKDGMAIMEPVTCKDYIQDVFYCQFNKESMSVYGFDWDYDSNLEDYFKGEEFQVAFVDDPLLIGCSDKLQSYLNQHEELFGFRKSTVEPINDDNGVLVTFSSEWADSAPVISMLMLFIRVGISYNDTELTEFAKSVRDGDITLCRDADCYSFETLFRVYPKLITNKWWPQASFDVSYYEDNIIQTPNSEYYCCEECDGNEMDQEIHDFGLMRYIEDN